MNFVVSRTYNTIGGNSSVCLGSWEMRDDCHHTYNWRIEIVNCVGELSIGIADEKQIVSRGFVETGFRWTKLGHGVYAIGTRQKVLSHHQEVENSKLSGFKFGKDDHISIQYDTTCGILIFEKGKEQKSMKV